MADSLCSALVEDDIGPIVANGCAHGFDFTLLFEESALTLLPLGLALFWALLRLSVLRQETTKVRKSWILASKMVCFSVYVALQIALLALFAGRGRTKSRLTVACVTLSIAGYILLMIVSYFEHLRSIRPSTMMCIYLGLSTLLDIARARTLFFLPNHPSISAVFLASLLIKFLILLLELTEKKRLFRVEWKGHSGEATSGAYNRALFIWLNDTFFKGFRSLLTVDSLTSLDSHILSAADPTLIAERWRKANKNRKYSLFLVFLRHFWWDFFAGVLPRLAYTGFMFAQPFMVQRVLDFIDEPQNRNTSSIAYGLIGAYSIVYIGLAVSYAVFSHKTYRLLTLYRGALVALIFDKTLRVSSTAPANAEAVTLMSADIDRIGSSFPLIHETWASFLDIALALWLLYRLLGVAMVAPILWIIICIVAGIPLATAAGNAQTPWLEAIEKRLAVTAKALGAMKAVKMAGLAETVSQKITALRLAEIRASWRHRVLGVCVTMAFYASSTLTPAWGFGVYILLAKSRNTGTLTESVAFAALSLFELLDQPLIFAVDGVEHLQTVLNSFRRIQEYLLSEERDEYRIMSAPITSSCTTLQSHKGLENVIELSEMAKEKPEGLSRLGEVEERAPIARFDHSSAGYAVDSKFVLRDLTFDIPRAKTTMIFGPVGCGKSTLLKHLLGEMRYTSGALQVNFAHAAYCPQTPWVTWGTVRDNILGQSTFDQTWYDTVITACSLRSDIRELPSGDQTTTGTRGSRLSGGQQMRLSLARALYARTPTVILDDVLKGLDRKTERSILDNVFGVHGILKTLSATVIMATSSSNVLKFADYVVVLNEDGEISQHGSADSITLKDLEESDIARVISGRDQDYGISNDQGVSELAELEKEEEQLSRRSGDMKVYAYFISIAGGWSMAAYLIACAVFVFGVIFPPIWLQRWTDANAIHPNEKIGYWLGVYASLAGVTLLGCLLADCIFTLAVIPKTSRKFHELLLRTTMRATTTFLTSTDSGKTINRFSQDLELIDNDLPMSMDSTVFQFLTVIASTVLVFMGSGYLAAAFPFCVLALGVVQFYYLRTSRQMRLLDIEAKAPLFSHFLETLGGLPCVRAYGWTDNYLRRHYEVLNASQKPYYLLWCIQRWLTLVLDLLVAALGIMLVSLATNIRNGSTGYLGVALFNIVTFSASLQTLVTQWTQVETAIGAVSRIRSYVTTVKDENAEDNAQSVPDSWPVAGAIVFEDVIASYDPQNPILVDVNLSISPGEKVAICGRTGSGKSSLVSSLLRMVDLNAGRILIDGVDLKTVSREELRLCLNTLPQEAFFLHGTLRQNLDPFQKSSDEQILQVLRSVRMWDYFHDNGGFDGEFSDESLSHGQRELLCLARAILKQSNILIMDEAMSSVDSETDKIVQEVIRKELQGRTIISVAHKLQSVLDFDRVVVLERGRIIETGRPDDLLQQSTSAFYSLYHSSYGDTALRS